MRTYGHMTGQVWREQLQTSKRGGKHNILFWSTDLAKLNPKYHMNYSIIFTEISFYPETSKLLNINFITCFKAGYRAYDSKNRSSPVFHKIT